MGALVVLQLGKSTVVHRKTFLFETFCCSGHELFQWDPDQKQNGKIVITLIRWRSISMRAGPTFLQFDWLKAGLSIEMPVFVYSHTKTGFKFFQYREDIGSLFMCLEIFDFKPCRENLTRLLLCLDLSKSVKVY